MPVLLLYLFAGGVLAGLSSSMASFASLISYPLLLSVGVPPVYANVTNDAALIWNSLGATIASGKELRERWRQVGTLAVFTVAGSVVGCILLLSFPAGVFEKVVPFFIAIAGVLILVSGHHQATPDKRLPVWQKAAYAFLLVVMGAYKGYFGAAAGVVVMVILTYMINEDFLVVNAERNVICGLAELVALAIYAFRSRIYWSESVPVALGMFLGGYVGPLLLRHISATVMRRVIAVLAFLQAGCFFWQAYL